MPQSVYKEVCLFMTIFAYATCVRLYLSFNQFTTTVILAISLRAVMCYNNFYSMGNVAMRRRAGECYHLEGAYRSRWINTNARQFHSFALQIKAR